LPRPTASRAMPQPLMPPPMMARSNTLSNETLPRRSPLHFGDFTFGWELITKKNESKTKAGNLRGKPPN
jgi:hypothetical protein